MLGFGIDGELHVAAMPLKGLDQHLGHLERHRRVVSPVECPDGKMGNLFHLRGFTAATDRHDGRKSMGRVPSRCFDQKRVRTRPRAGF